MQRWVAAAICLALALSTPPLRSFRCQLERQFSVVASWRGSGVRAAGHDTGVLTRGRRLPDDGPSYSAVVPVPGMLQSTFVYPAITYWSYFSGEFGEPGGDW